MRNNIENQVKEVTIIIPESVDILDITYYWKRSNGRKVKTQVLLMDDDCNDGNEVVCCDFLR